jgi:hypothetical protein
VKPPRSILSKDFAYTPARAHEGDPQYLLRKFRRIQREQKANETQAAQVVRQIKRKEQR